MLATISYQIYQVIKLKFICHHGERAISTSDFMSFVGWKDILGNQSQLACHLLTIHEYHAPSMSTMNSTAIEYTFLRKRWLQRIHDTVLADRQVSGVWDAFENRNKGFNKKDIAISWKYDHTKAFFAHRA